MFEAGQGMGMKSSTQPFIKQNGNMELIPAPSTQKDSSGCKSISSQLQKDILQGGSWSETIWEIILPTHK